jgi:glycine cleavage system H protein
MSSKIPADLKYAKSHEWVRIEGEVATVGITDHAQHELTDIAFIEPPAVGRKVAAGEACAVVESVKTASDIYSPVSGEVIGANQTVVDQPGLANTDPYGEGWLYKVKMDQPGDLEKLITPEQYKSHIGV